MDNFQVETAQNVNIVHNVAGVGDRIVAYLLDGLFMGVYAIIVFVIFANTEISSDHFFIVGLTIGLPLFLYHLLWETLYNGQSPGKDIMQLRVVKIDGSKPAFSNYLLRWLLRSIEITATSGALALVTILLNGKGQRLGDVAAVTTVISEKETVSLSQTLLTEIPDNYSPTYPQVTIFSDSEMQTIKNIYTEARYHRNHKVILELAIKVANLMEVKYEDKPLSFLDTVIKDYNHFTQNM